MNTKVLIFLDFASGNDCKLFPLPHQHWNEISTLGWAKMHDVFKSLLPRYFLKDIYVK